MAKKNVVEITCDRCDRTELVDPEMYNPKADLELYFGPRKVEEGNPGADSSTIEVVALFNDLCSSCKKTVKNLSEQIAKKISWKRSKGEDSEAKEEEGADA